jgi:hypothetical protein
MTENTQQLSRLSTETTQVSSVEPTTISTRMKYYDLKKNWHRVKPHLGNKRLNEILVRDFNKFTFGRWGRKFTYGDLPYEFESCDWDIDHECFLSGTATRPHNEIDVSNLVAFAHERFASA